MHSGNDCRLGYIANLPSNSELRHDDAPELKGQALKRVLPVKLEKQQFERLHSATDDELLPIR